MSPERRAIIDGLRALADTLEQQAGIPTPREVEAYRHMAPDEFAAAMAATGNPERHVSQCEGTRPIVVGTLRYGPVTYSVQSFDVEDVAA